MTEIKRPKLTLVIRWITTLFLVVTGIMTATSFSMESVEGSEKLKSFMTAMYESGYIITWVGLFKAITGVLLIFNKTRRLAAIMLIPYSVNILLYTIFIGQMFIPMAIFLSTLNTYLIYAYWNYYKPIFEKK